MPRGRKTEGSAVKLAPLNMRTSPQLRQQIEKAADENGRSLTQEVERRLVTSFIFDEVRGGPHIGAFANMLSSVIQTIENRMGAKWTDDPATHAAVRAAAEHLLDWNRPPVQGDDLSATFAKAKDAQEKQRAAEKALHEYRDACGWPNAVDLLMNIGADHRASWTDEQKQREARLAVEVEAATQSAREATARFMELADPITHNIAAGTGVGREEGARIFAALGPRGANGPQL